MEEYIFSMSVCEEDIPSRSPGRAMDIPVTSVYSPNPLLSSDNGNVNSSDDALKQEFTDYLDQSARGNSPLMFYCEGLDALETDSPLSYEDSNISLDVRKSHNEIEEMEVYQTERRKEYAGEFSGSYFNLLSSDMYLFEILAESFSDTFNVYTQILARDCTGAPALWNMFSVMVDLIHEILQVYEHIIRFENNFGSFSDLSCFIYQGEMFSPDDVIRLVTEIVSATFKFVKEYVENVNFEEYMKKSAIEASEDITKKLQGQLQRTRNIHDRQTPKFASAVSDIGNTVLSRIMSVQIYIRRIRELLADAPHSFDAAVLGDKEVTVRTDEFRSDLQDIYNSINRGLKELMTGDLSSTSDDST